MISKIILSAVVFVAAVNVSAWQAQAQTSFPADANSNVATDIAKIAASAQAMTKTLKEFVDKFARADGLTLTEKQQRLITGMQVLVQSEQRAAVLQKFQIELVEKEAQLRTRIAQIEIDLNPQQIDRSVAFEGSTQAPEIKENKRRTLLAERSSLQSVLQQLQSNLFETASSVRDAMTLVFRLRRMFLPQVEREMAEQ